MRKSKNNLSKVPSWCNLLKDKVLYVEIEEPLPVEILYTGYEKKKKNKNNKNIKINTIVKPLASSLHSESKNKLDIYTVLCEVVICYFFFILKVEYKVE